LGGEGGIGFGGDCGQEAGEQLGIDGAGAFEPAAVINAAFMQDGPGDSGGLDAVEQLADGLVVALLDARGGTGKGNARGQPFAQGSWLASVADTRGDVEVAQAMQQSSHGVGSPGLA